jgi:hypothetical protein
LKFVIAELEGRCGIEKVKSIMGGACESERKAKSAGTGGE